MVYLCNSRAAKLSFLAKFLVRKSADCSEGILGACHLRAFSHKLLLPRSGTYAGPGQERYGRYFRSVQDPTQPQQSKRSAKMLRQIVVSGFDTLNYKALLAAGGMSDFMGGEEMSTPFLVVFQHGKAMWGGYPRTQVLAASCSPSRA